MSQTTVNTVYSKTLNVSVSSKGTVTLWTTGDPARSTVRLPVGSPLIPKASKGTVKVSPAVRRSSLRRVAG